MPDQRTALERKAWDLIGPPLYYCAECLRGVKVTPVDGGEPNVERRCDCNAQIIAPRRAVCVGKGGMSLPTRAKVAAMQLGAAITGRCV